MKMPRDGARVRRCLKKASAKRRTIKCVRHPGQKRRATNQSHNSHARAAVDSEYQHGLHRARRTGAGVALHTLLMHKQEYSLRCRARSEQVFEAPATTAIFY